MTDVKLTPEARETMEQEARELREHLADPITQVQNDIGAGRGPFVVRGAVDPTLAVNAALLPEGE